jgi:1,4-dihydroxy-2-naphthoate octaprenyltransferase
VGVALGVAAAYHDLNQLNLGTAALTMIFAIVAHAGVNVLNDYFDALNGTDAANTQRIYPFTGGSRFIQNGVLTIGQTKRFGYLLLLTVVPAGLFLVARSGPGLLLVGLAGMFIGWAYSATPLTLNSRGWGELCVAGGFLCVVVGADYVQRGQFHVTPFAAGLPYALMVTNVLYINQFPDRAADLAAGKLHWVARLDPKRAAWGYVLIAGLSVWLLCTSVLVRECLPMSALFALVAVAPSTFAAWELVRKADRPSALAPAIKATIAAALVHGVGLSVGLVVGR